MTVDSKQFTTRLFSILLFSLLVVALFSTVIYANEYDCATGRHRDVVVSRVEPTSTENGLETVQCELCGRIYRFVLYYDPGHSWGGWSVIIEPTCTTAGLRRRICTQHSGCTQSEEMPALGHDWLVEITPPTCDEPGARIYICSRCGETRAEPGEEAIGHEYAAEITREPSCTEDGEMTFTCIRCGDSYIEVIYAVGHLWGDWIVEVQATENEEGLEVRICTVCGERGEGRIIPVLVIAESLPLFNIVDAVAAGSSAFVIAFFCLFTIPLILAIIKERRHFAAYKVRKKTTAERKEQHDFRELY